MYAGWKDDVKMVNRWFLLGIRVWPYSVLLVYLFNFHHNILPGGSPPPVFIQLVHMFNQLVMFGKIADVITVTWLMAQEADITTCVGNIRTFTTATTADAATFFHKNKCRVFHVIF